MTRSARRSRQHRRSYRGHGGGIREVVADIRGRLLSTIGWGKTFAPPAAKVPDFVPKAIDTTPTMDTKYECQLDFKIPCAAKETVDVLVDLIDTLRHFRPALFKKDVVYQPFSWSKSEESTSSAQKIREYNEQLTQRLKKEPELRPALESWLVSPERALNMVNATNAVKEVLQTMIYFDETDPFYIGHSDDNYPKHPKFIFRDVAMCKEVDNDTGHLITDKHPEIGSKLTTIPYRIETSPKFCKNIKGKHVAIYSPVVTNSISESTLKHVLENNISKLAVEDRLFQVINIASQVTTIVDMLQYREEDTIKYAIAHLDISIDTICLNKDSEYALISCPYNMHVEALMRGYHGFTLDANTVLDPTRVEYPPEAILAYFAYSRMGIGYREVDAKTVAANNKVAPTFELALKKMNGRVLTEMQELPHRIAKTINEEWLRVKKFAVLQDLLKDTVKLGKKNHSLSWAKSGTEFHQSVSNLVEYMILPVDFPGQFKAILKDEKNRKHLSSHILLHLIYIDTYQLIMLFIKLLCITDTILEVRSFGKDSLEKLAADIDYAARKVPPATDTKEKKREPLLTRIKSFFASKKADPATRPMVSAADNIQVMTVADFLIAYLSRGPMTTEKLDMILLALTASSPSRVPLTHYVAPALINFHPTLRPASPVIHTVHATHAALGTYSPTHKAYYTVLLGPDGKPRVDNKGRELRAWAYNPDQRGKKHGGPIRTRRNLSSPHKEAKKKRVRFH
jgi:hypothetical protein